MRIECLIVHNIPGRVRLRVGNKQAVRVSITMLERFLVGRSGTGSVRINANCSSIIVDYDPASLTAQKLADEVSRFLDQLLTKASREGPRATTTSATAGASAIHWRGQWSREIGRAWHELDADEVIRALDADLKYGLQAEDAGQRLLSCGRNRLGEISQRSAWSTLADQFTSLPVALLLGSAVVSLATAGVADAAVILGVVTINACIGFVTERQAERTIASLQDKSESQATVLRAGRRQQIAAELVVPGDVVVLTPGTEVAADLRLIETQRLMVDESALTGESMPVGKSPHKLVGEPIALRDRDNMSYRGTIVTSGSGIGVVVATGPRSEVGQIQSLVGAARTPETPVQRQLRELGTQLGLLTGAICGGIFGVGILRRYGAIEMLKTATSLAVAAVPEGLPMVATTTLALGVNRMRRLNVAVRRLDAVEALGSVEYFCLDKTGTLTRNEMQVVRLLVGDRATDFDHGPHNGDHALPGMLRRRPYRQLLEIAVLCNEADVHQQDGITALDGSPTESALIRIALDAEIDVLGVRSLYRVIRTEYRAEDRSFMTTEHETDSGGRLWAVKGRPADVLELCRWKCVEQGCVELTDRDREVIKTENEIMAGRSLRVLGFAYREDPVSFDGQADHVSKRSCDHESLTWLGLAGIADPIRAGMCDLIQKFQAAGIRTTMITGDQSATAHAIGRQLRLSGEPELRTMDSAELESIQPDVLKSLAENVHVFSSVTPSHKLAIVQALQRAGKVVAMTGDGINDGPALKAADVGVAMGGVGSADVARMTADVVLEDNNLQSMVTAIRQGRGIYANTRNAIRYLLSTNMSEIMVMFVGVASGAGSPLNPMQLLWINLVSDIFPVLALAVQPPETDILQRKPRDANEPFIDQDDLRRMLVESTVISGGTFASYAWGRYRYGTESYAGTMAFMSISMAQLLHMLSARSDRLGIFSGQQPPTNEFFKYAFFTGFGLQLLTPLVGPLRRLLRNSPLSPLDLAISLAAAGSAFVINEAIKEVRTAGLVEKTGCESEFPAASEGASP